MSLHEDRASGSLVNAAGFHTHHAVFHNINNADTMLSAKLVEGGNDFGYLHFLTIDGGGNTLLKSHGYIFSFVRSLFGSGAQHQQMLEIRLVCRILQFQTFVADMPDIPIPAVGGIGRKRKVDSVGLAVFDFGFTGIHGPLVISPGSNDLDVRSQRLDAQFKADLVVAFAGCTVADGRSTFLAGNFHQLLCDQGPCHGSTKQVLVFIYCAGLHTGHHIFVAKFINNVFNVQFGSAAGLCTFLQAVQFFRLTAVNADTDNLVVKIFLQPGDDGGGVQTAGVSQNYFFFHNESPP